MTWDRPRQSLEATSLKPTDGADAALAVVRRLLQTLQSENAALSLNSGMIDHSEYNLLKSQALLALNRCAPKPLCAGSKPALRMALAEAVAALETNHRLLATQLEAAQAVAAIIARAIREVQSDGTYTRTPSSAVSP
ncbi:MAG: hypothetical protein WAK01_15630 [Methylocystis sp.]